jgi:hypothetical protein
MQVLVIKDKRKPFPSWGRGPKNFAFIVVKDTGTLPMPHVRSNTDTINPTDKSALFFDGALMVYGFQQHLTSR